jgi:hypothetical protein
MDMRAKNKRLMSSVLPIEEAPLNIPARRPEGVFISHDYSLARAEQGREQGSGLVADARFGCEKSGVSRR